jgi:hypothetical protein
MTSSGLHPEFNINMNQSVGALIYIDETIHRMIIDPMCWKKEFCSRFESILTSPMAMTQTLASNEFMSIESLVFNQTIMTEIPIVLAELEADLKTPDVAMELDQVRLRGLGQFI